MGTKVKLCEVSEVAPGQMLRIDQPEVPPLAVYNLNGDFFITSNICTHNIAMLTDGYLDGDIVECPLHGGCFNVRTGAPTNFPCEKPLQTYPAVVESGSLYVEI